MQQLAHLLQDHEYKEAIPRPLNALSLSITSAEETAVKIHNQQSKTTELKQKLCPPITHSTSQV